MGALNERLKKEISDFDIANDNLEIELGKEKYQDKIPEIKKVIWHEINEADKLVLERLTTNNSRDFNGIKLLIHCRPIKTDFDSSLLLTGLLSVVAFYNFSIFKSKPP